MISCKNQMKLFFIFIFLERKWSFIDLRRFFRHKRVLSLLLSIVEIDIEKTMFLEKSTLGEQAIYPQGFHWKLVSFQQHSGWPVSLISQSHFYRKRTLQPRPWMLHQWNTLSMELWIDNRTAQNHLKFIPNSAIMQKSNNFSEFLSSSSVNELLLV